MVIERRRLIAGFLAGASGVVAILLCLAIILVGSGLWELLRDVSLSASLQRQQEQALALDIQDNVLRIFEACNFQDLTGQRISKVMATMKFIEHHITVMMDIWGGVDAIRAHAPRPVDDRVGDARLLNGPKLPGDAGHASQDDIDAMFG